MDNIINLALTYAVFLIAAGSPGPATLAIMATSATAGRKAGVLFALGVVNGSIIWGILAAFGLVALLSQFAWAFMVLKFAGGAYLLWMASKALRAAMTPKPCFHGQLSSLLACPKKPQLAIWRRCSSVVRSWPLCFSSATPSCFPPRA